MRSLPPVIWHFPASELPDDPALRQVWELTMTLHVLKWVCSQNFPTLPIQRIQMWSIKWYYFSKPSHWSGILNPSIWLDNHAGQFFDTRQWRCSSEIEILFLESTGSWNCLKFSQSGHLMRYSLTSGYYALLIFFFFKKAISLCSLINSLTDNLDLSGHVRGTVLKDRLNYK